jgi:acyl phosphate:glycerol-3-phosphate acyltransferase
MRDFSRFMSRFSCSFLSIWQDREIAMTTWLMVGATFVVAYLLGSIPTGYLFAKYLKGIDIRTVGSGSIGATNVLRTLGKKAGSAVLIIDILKGMGAVVAVQLLYFWLSQYACVFDKTNGEATRQLFEAIAAGLNNGDSISGKFDNPIVQQCVDFIVYKPWVIVTAGIFAILGHSKSVWLNFAGGKSVATSLGFLLALNWLVGLGAFGVFAISAAITKIVSISSILAAIAAMILMFALGQPLAYQLFAIAGGSYVIWRHRANIDRLRKGTEPKIGQKV